MELKHVQISWDDGWDFSFNRTSMELKHKHYHSAWTEVLAFNRTSMELKPKRNAYRMKRFDLLLIEPVWN